jgi:hypothetical protein
MTVRVEVQHFIGCPNSKKMIEIVKEAINSINIEVSYFERLVETIKEAKELKFRGSPTVLINGKDLEGLPVPEFASLSCRFYSNGLPTVENVKNAILKEFNS